MKLETNFAGAMPFWVTMVVFALTLLVFPEIALVLPNAMFATP